MLDRQAVDLGRVDAPVDGARHERQAARPGGIVVLRHERGGGQRLHARLADGDHVRARADHAEELDEVVRVAVEAERARLARDLHDSLAKTLHGLALTADALAEGTGHLPPDTLRHRAVQVADARRLFVEIAAIAVAAIEAVERWERRR